MKKEYSKDIIANMQLFYKSLNEKEKRIYSATEAKKYGHGGQVYISKLLGCSRDIISRGIKELKNPNIFSDNRIRKEGGGRKPYYITYPNIDKDFLKILEKHTAGDPMNKETIWTNLTQEEISLRLKENGTDVSVIVVKQLLKKHGYVKRKAQKKIH